MAYEKHNWVCGETITADLLNNLESGVEEALECCGGGTADVGYSCTEEWVTLTDESVTTAVIEGNSFATGVFTYSEPITADTIKVIFNGTEYTCNKMLDGNSTPLYGGFGDLGVDFSEYPFSIESVNGNNLATKTAGTYQIKIEALGETIETSECFRKAVESVRTGAFQVRAVSKDAETEVVTYNCSASQLQDAFERGDYITFYDELSGLVPLMLRDCVVGWDNNHPTLVGMVNYVTRQTTASNSQVTSLMFEFNAPSSADEILTSGGNK